MSKKLYYNYVLGSKTNEKKFLMLFIVKPKKVFSPAVYLAVEFFGEYEILSHSCNPLNVLTKLYSDYNIDPKHVDNHFNYANICLTKDPERENDIVNMIKAIHEYEDQIKTLNDKIYKLEQNQLHANSDSNKISDTESDNSANTDTELEKSETKPDKVSKPRASKESHNHDEVSVFYRRYIKLKEGAKSDIGIIFKYFNDKYPDIDKNKFIESLKILAEQTGEFSIEDDKYIVGAIYQKTINIYSKDESEPIIRNTGKRGPLAVERAKVDDIPEEDAKKIHELYKTISAIDIQKIHFPQYDFKQIDKCVRRADFRKLKSSKSTHDKILEFNGTKTAKEMAELIGVTESTIRNTINHYKLPYKKVPKGNPNLGKIRAEAAAAKRFEATKEGIDIIINKFIENHFVPTNNIQDSIKVSDAKDMYLNHCKYLEVDANVNDFMVAMRSKFKSNTKFTAFVFVKYIK